MSDEYVHVVFHGVFAFVRQNKHIDVLCPYFAPHEYLLGFWDYSEKGRPAPSLLPIGKGDYHLRGLTPNSAKPSPDFDSARNPTVRGFAGRNEEWLYASIRLPHPESVYLFRDYSNNNKTLPFGGVHGQALKLNRMAGPVVFRYKADGDLANVKVLWRDKPVPIRFIPNPAYQNTLNIHFFAEGEHDMPCACDPDYPYQVGHHYLEAWRRLTTLVAGLDIQLGQIQPFIAGAAKDIPSAGEVPNGLPPTELRELDELYRMNHPCRMCGDAGAGGSRDCGKAHVVVDNFGLAEGEFEIRDPE